MKNIKNHQNQLEVYRRRMRFAAGRVALLLGHQDSSILAQYERGKRLPSLINILRLGIILRVPVEFLYPGLYDKLREEIRTEEDRLSQPTQQSLF